MMGGAANPNGDFPVNPSPTDGISELAFSPKENYLVASSWDQHVRCWQITNQGQSVAKASMQHQGPALCCTWSGDGTKFFSGGCDNKAMCFDVTSGKSMQVAQHAGPIKCCKMVNEGPAFVTGSWDKTLKYWDLRQGQPVANVPLPERCYAMDVKFPLVVVATAERHVSIFDMRKPTQEWKRIVSPLKYQSRCVAAFPDRSGFALGSIEGRVAVHHVEDRDKAKNFAFKCHRHKNMIYAVNSIAFHPVFGTFATSGSDGTFHFWDKDSKQRLKAFNPCAAPIPTCTFNGNGTIFAYAVSYDWHKGSDGYTQAMQSTNQIFLHAVLEGEIKNRPRQ